MILLEVSEQRSHPCPRKQRGANTMWDLVFTNVKQKYFWFQDLRFSTLLHLRKVVNVFIAFTSEAPSFVFKPPARIFVLKQKLWLAWLGFEALCVVTGTGFKTVVLQLPLRNNSKEESTKEVIPLLFPLTFLFFSNHKYVTACEFFP